jgi:hypothetical protein
MRLRPNRVFSLAPRKWILLLVALALGGCSLLDPPPGPIIPTPPAGSQVQAVDFSELALVTDPVSAIAPAVDPDIEALMNAVSQQQLLAYVQTLEGFRTRSSFSETQRPDYGIGAARQWIYDEFLRVNSGGLQVAFDDFPATISGLATNQRNVIATLPGISGYPGIVVISAHYDSRTIDPMDGFSAAPGANDNASGVAILLELARLMSSRSWNQTIVFAAFAAEEQGTHGSRHYVQNMMLDGRTFDAAINNDIVGGRPGIPQAIRLFAQGPDTSPSSQLARYFELVGGLYLPAFRVEWIDSLDRPDRYSDHREFINAGVAGVRLTEFQEDFDTQHNAFDTWDRIDYDYLRQVAQLDLIVAANLAGGTAPPPPPTIAPMADPGAYILTWAPDPQAAGYAISFRPVGSIDFAPFFYVSAGQAGNVALTGLDPQISYAVSLAAIDSGGRISGFSPEIIAGPPA